MGSIYRILRELMMKKLNDLLIEDVEIIKPVVHKDERGWFLESYNQKMNLSKFQMIQENHSFTKKAFTFRGFHHQQYPYSQDKIVRCLRGTILDIIIDLRPHSTSYLSSISIQLSSSNNYQLFIPNGCFHGFLTLTDDVEVIYKVNCAYNKESEISLNPFDIDLTMVDWMNHSILHLSKKDKNGQSLRDILQTMR